MIKLLANENIPLKSVEYLRKKGFNVKYAGTDLKSYSDQVIINLSNKQGRLIITFDKDYGKLIFKKGLKPSSGVIILRIESYTPDEPGKMVAMLLEKQEIRFKNFLTVYDGKFIRQKKF